MSLRLRVLVFTGLAFALLFAGLHWSLRAMLLDRFARIETASVVQDVGRATRGLQREIDALERTCIDWAQWDDMYRFVVDHNPEFARANLVVDSFSVLDLDVIVLVDTSGEVVTAIAPTPERSALQAVPATLLSVLTRAGVLGRTAADPGRAGLLSTPQGIMAVASRAVLPSEPTGVSRGTLVMGRYLGSESFSNLGDALRLNLTAQPAADYAAGDGGIDPGEVIRASGPVVRPLDAHRVVGLTVLTDLAGVPALVIRVESGRTVFRQGVLAVRFLLLTLGAATVIVAAIILVLLERSVLAPLARLEAGVQAVAESGSTAVRVERVGGGELERLSVRINEMLGALEQAERDRLASEERFRSLFERSPLAIFLLDPTSWQVVACNQAAADMTGHTRDELVAHGLGLLRASEGGQRVAASDDDVTRALASRGAVMLVGQRRRADGQLVPVEATISIVADSKEGIVMSIERDISERLRAEEQLRQSQKLEAVATLAGGVAHNFNNVLQVIGGLASLMREEPHLTAGDREQLDRIEAEVGRAATLTSKLIVFSREQQGTARRVDLRALLHDQEESVRAAVGPCIDVHLTLPGDPVWVCTDARQIATVLAALADNAREAMPAGGILDVTLTTSGEQSGVIASCDERRWEDWARLTVTDTGRGMDESTRQRVFEPFFSTKGLGSGTATGMGLTLARAVVAQHGGCIEVDSTPGVGTTVAILLPLAEPRQRSR